MGTDTNATEQEILTLDDLKGLKPINNSFGLAGKIIKYGDFEAHVQEEQYSPSSTSEPGSVDYTCAFDLYVKGELVKKGSLSVPASYPYDSFALTFFTEGFDD